MDEMQETHLRSLDSLVMVTGAAGGLGKAFAVECASRGWNLFLTDLSEEALATLGTALGNTYGVRVFWHPADLTDQNSTSLLFQYIQERRLQFWGLINIAGTSFEGLFNQQTMQQIRMMTRLNIDATLEMTHTLLQWRDPQAVFRIINIASLAAFYPMPFKAAYAATKRFLVDFSLALGEELRELGTTVTVLCPAGLPTVERSITGLERQGLIGYLTTFNIGTVAARTLDHALDGKPVYVPGLLNRVLGRLGSILPAEWTARILGMRWRNAYRKDYSRRRTARLAGEKKG